MVKFEGKKCLFLFSLGLRPRCKKLAKDEQEVGYGEFLIACGRLIDKALVDKVVARRFLCEIDSTGRTKWKTASERAQKKIEKMFHNESDRKVIFKIVEA